MSMQDDIIPYVPIAPRVKATNEKSKLVLEQFFKLIDKVTSSQILFNHQTDKGYLSISPDQINDLIRELSKNDHSIKEIDVNRLKRSLKDLIYPKFTGVRNIISPIWNNTSVRVWQFQLNQIATGVDMEYLDTEAELSLDMVLSSIRVWRNTLEASGNDKEVTYNSNDLIYKLIAIEERLLVVQKSLED